MKMNVRKELIMIDEREYEALEVELPKTTLILISSQKGFVMCGALDIDIYNSPKLLPREVLCVKAIGVRTLNDLINGEVYDSSIAAQKLGIHQGMKIKDALAILS